MTPPSWEGLSKGLWRLHRVAECCFDVLGGLGFASGGAVNSWT